MSTDHRVVKQFRIERRTVKGRHHIDVRTLGGALVDQYEGWSDQEVSARMHEAGYQNEPPQIADTIDLLNAHHEVPHR